MNQNGYIQDNEIIFINIMETHHIVRYVISNFHQYRHREV